MSAPPLDLPPNEIAFFLHTNAAVPAASLVRLIVALDRLAHSEQHFGANALFELIEVRTGTKLLKFLVDKGIDIAALAIAIAAYQGDIEERAKGEPDSEVATVLAELCVDHGVSECV